MNRYYIVVSRWAGKDMCEEKLAFTLTFNKESEIFNWLSKYNEEQWPTWLISFYKKIEE